MHDYADILGRAGPLARTLDGFAPREQQQRMAQAVAEAIEQRDALVCEAGTGTGKTFAYLVPALLAGRRVIVSTGTKHLQDQLYHRDLPQVARALGAPVSVALLKGRANYLCLHRLDLAEQEGEFASRAQIADLQQVRQWRRRTRSGDSSELEAVSEDSPVWPRVTSTTENCLGSECPQFGDCFVLKARRQAQEADVVVINHHLLLADMVLKEEGFGELLPGADAVIVDEAHQLPETGAQYFGLSFSARQVQDLCRDARAETLKTLGNQSGLEKILDKLDKAVKDVRLALGDRTGRIAWQDLSASQVGQALEALYDHLAKLADELEKIAEHSRGLETCQRRTNVLIERLDPFLSGASEEQVRWCEVFQRAFTLNLTPVDIAEKFRSRFAAQPCAWVFTSATLAVDGSTTHFSARLGLEDPRELVLGSPFDYPQNARLYLPAGLPDVTAPRYTREVVQAALPLLQASQGRAFLLFTSYRALNEAAELLAGIDHPLLIQGTAPRARLLERFREHGNAVLLGTSSFWEGVDVKGPALSLVVIDKLPFASPGDPLLQARLDALRRAGRNPFVDYQLPQAVIALKQGVGRLIRDAGDTGVMMLCDPRLRGKGYGRTFLASLPPMRRTSDAQEVLDFLRTRTYLDPAQEASA